MRNLLALLGAAVVTVVGVGWYLDWFKVHKGNSGNGTQNYNVEFNTNKISDDLHKGGTKLQEAIDRKLQEHKKPSTPEGPSFPTDPPSPTTTRTEDGSPYSLTSQKNEKTEKVPEPPVSGPEFPFPLPPEIKPPQR